MRIHNLCFEAKIMYTPVKPQFCYIKVWCEASKSHGCINMMNISAMSLLQTPYMYM